MKRSTCFSSPRKDLPTPTSPLPPGVSFRNQPVTYTDGSPAAGRGQSPHMLPAEDCGKAHPAAPGLGPLTFIRLVNKVKEPLRL